MDKFFTTLFDVIEKLFFIIAAIIYGLVYGLINYLIPIALSLSILYHMIMLIIFYIRNLDTIIIAILCITLFVGVFGLLAYIAEKIGKKFGSMTSFIIFFILFDVVIAISPYKSEIKKHISETTHLEYDSTKSSNINTYGTSTTSINIGNSTSNETLKIKIPIPNKNLSTITNDANENQEYYIGKYHSGYDAYLLINTIKKPCQCTVKATGEGKTYYITYNFYFDDKIKWRFSNSQGFDGEVNNETPMEQKILEYCERVDWRPVKLSSKEKNNNDTAGATNVPLSNQMLAQNKLIEFHVNITNKLYKQAYDCLTEKFKQQIKYDKWIQGFNTTISSTPYNIQIEFETENQIILTYTLQAIDKPNIITYYKGKAVLINTKLNWKIDKIQNKLE